MADAKIIIGADYSDEVIEASKEAIQLALKSIGEEAEGYAKNSCPVDMGILKNSISFKTADAEGTGDSTPKGAPPDGELQVGTNVKYAKYQEFGERYHHKVGGPHFLRNSIANHGDHYKEILKAALDD